jgi:hypothetical protein
MQLSAGTQQSLDRAQRAAVVVDVLEHVHMMMQSNAPCTSASACFLTVIRGNAARARMRLPATAASEKSIAVPCQPFCARGALTSPQPAADLQERPRASRTANEAVRGSRTCGASVEENWPWGEGKAATVLPASHLMISGFGRLDEAQMTCDRVVACGCITPRECLQGMPLGTKGSFTSSSWPEHLPSRIKDAMCASELRPPVMIMVMENAALMR